MTYTLYEFPPTRSQRARWLFAELAVDYESRLFNLPAGEQDGETYRTVHPLGAVPALATAG